MRALRVTCAAAALFALALALPATASAFTIYDGGAGPAQNAYGVWFAGQAKCASPECHKAIADVPTVHGSMVTDIKADPAKATPTNWGIPTGGAAFQLEQSDMYLQIGDRFGLLQFIGSADTTKVAPITPLGDLVQWSPVGWEQETGEWEPATTAVTGKTYSQSCSGCHNLGVTRPSNAPYTLANGGTISTDTPSGFFGPSIQCEVCHGSGSDPAVSAHRDGVPEVVSGPRILKAQVCGQCHVTGTTAEKNASGKSFGNPNGYTTDETLTAYFTPVTTVPSESEFASYLADGGTKPSFLPNGANYSLRHSYYNEWLLNKAPNGYGHVSPMNPTVTKNASATKCAGCHSGLGFLSRIGASYPSTDGVTPGSKIQTATPTIPEIQSDDPGISCQVCHSGHVGYGEYGYDQMRTWGADSARPNAAVTCGDCHNWQYEVMGQVLQTETVAGETYHRPAANGRVSHPQREMLSGGYGGDLGDGGMWGIEPTGPQMGSTACADCHMPRTSKEGMPVPDDGTTEATRMSHRFHAVLPGDAKRWGLRLDALNDPAVGAGDSCSPACHNDEASTWNRDQFQAWIDDVQASVGAKSDEATVALGSIATELAQTAGWSKFLSAQPTTLPASALSPAEWTMLQHAAQNAQFVINDASRGVHNAPYAEAGLDKAAYWISSFDPAVFDISVEPGYRNGNAGVGVTGSLRGHDGDIIKGASVTLEASTDGGGTWSSLGSADASATSFAIPSGALAGDTMLRFAFEPAEGVIYTSQTVTVSVPKTTIVLDPVEASMGWLDAASVGVTLEAAPEGAITFFSLSGAEVLAPSVYGGPFWVTAEGQTAVTYWSVDANGTEAIHTVPIRLDRSLPTVGSDAKTLYADTATIKVTGSDTASPISAVKYSLDGGSWAYTVGGTASVTTSVLGSHTLKACAVDSAGHVSAERTWTFSVKTTPKLYKSPNVTSISKRPYQTQTFAVTVRRASGAAVVGKYMYLERSTNGRTWTRIASVKTTSSGVASKAVKFSARGYTYWRWTCASDAYYNLVRTTNTKVTVR